jgi:iron complex outermembrane receptor protein
MYQERYLWIPLEANAGIGDGNNYVGNPELNPEEAEQIELGFDWNFGDYYFSPRLYHREVDDYIQGIPATNMMVIAVSGNANGDATPLMFANTDAEFDGIDLSFGARLNNNWRLEGIASMVKADRDDISDHLYRVNPNNLRLALYYETANFTAKIEQVLVDEQDDISFTNTFDPLNGNNSADKTRSHELTNVFLTWVLDNNWVISAGAENLFDEDYVDHLSGFNRVVNSAVPVGSRMFGRGRNLFGRAQFQW